MKDEFYLGSCPANEDCVQVDPNSDYIPAMKAELRKYKELLEKLFPIPEDLSCYFTIRWESHDFGRYGEIVIVYNDEKEEEIEFALNVENNTPSTWDEDVKSEGVLRKFFKGELK